jgi:hypothetical protein
MKEGSHTKACIGKETQMSTQARETTLEQLIARRQKIRRTLTAVEQQIQRTGR